MKYDILTEPWLPVRELSGEVTNVGLLELLEEAHRFEAIDGLNPMEEYSVLRFLSVFLTAVFRPKRWRVKFELLKEGSFDMSKIQAYIELCHKEGVSFDIFDEKRPFMQAMPNSEYDKQEHITSSAKLNSTRASGHNHIHYDHTLEKDASMSPAEAFVGILTTQVFCPSDGSGYYPCINYKKGQGQPLYFLPKGKTLFETLILAMFTISGDSNEREVWFNDMEIIHKEDGVNAPSKLYGMMFPSRRIRLIVDGGLVKREYFQPGLHLASKSGWTDPHVAYYLDKNEIRQITPSMDREGWRNIRTLAIQFAKNEADVPAVLRDYVEILSEQNQTMMEILAFGVVISSNAKYDDLQRGTFTLDTRIITNIKKSTMAGDMIAFMEEQGNILYNKLKIMLVNEKRLERTKKTRKKPNENKIIRIRHDYFSRCEKIFYEYSDRLAEQDADLSDLDSEFRNKVKRLLFFVLEEAENMYCSTADELIRAEKAMNRQFQKNKRKGR